LQLLLTENASLREKVKDLNTTSLIEGEASPTPSPLNAPALFWPPSLGWDFRHDVIYPMPSKEKQMLGGWVVLFRLMLVHSLFARKYVSPHLVFA
jgi:hypothetical protein